MLRDLRTAVVAAITFTVLLGVGYPLAMTGVSRLVAPGRADGSIGAHGSRLIGQDFSRDPSLFQSRPSATGYSASATAFNNQGPNQKALATQLRGFVRTYLRRERPYTPGLTAARIPVDAVTTSASGIDPDISAANARIQAARVAARRDLPRGRVLALVGAHDHHGSVNVLELNQVVEEATR